MKACLKQNRIKQKSKCTCTCLLSGMRPVDKCSFVLQLTLALLGHCNLLETKPRTVCMLDRHFVNFSSCFNCAVLDLSHF